jgi:hypothetical protein
MDLFTLEGGPLKGFKGLQKMRNSFGKFPSPNII